MQRGQRLQSLPLRLVAHTHLALSMPLTAAPYRKPGQHGEDVVEKGLGSLVDANTMFSQFQHEVRGVCSEGLHTPAPAFL